MRDKVEELVAEYGKVLSFEETEHSLTVSISESPAISYLRSTNCEPCRYYVEQTRTLYSTVADCLNLSFYLDYYEDSGKTRFSFVKRTNEKEKKQ
jgi:hypothetical protein